MRYRQTGITVASKETVLVTQRMGSVVPYCPILKIYTPDSFEFEVPEDHNLDDSHSDHDMNW